MLGPTIVHRISFNIITVGSERFRCLEVLFQQSFFEQETHQVSRVPTFEWRACPRLRLKASSVPTIEWLFCPRLGCSFINVHQQLPQGEFNVVEGCSN